MLRRSQATVNLANVARDDDQPVDGAGIRQLGRNFGVFDRADVERVAQNPQHIVAIADAIDDAQRNVAANTSRSAPAA